MLSTVLDFVSKDAVEIDKRAAAWFYFTFYPKVLTDHAGTVYLAPIADSDGRPLQAGKTYKLRVPKDIPARQFWSLTMYNRDNLGVRQEPTRPGGLGLVQHEADEGERDGSVDLYVGPKRACRAGIELDSDHGQGALSVVPALCSGGGVLEQIIQDA